METGVAHGRGRHAESEGEPDRKPAGTKVENPADQTGHITERQPAKADILPVLQCHQAQDYGEADQLDVLNESDRVGEDNSSPFGSLRFEIVILT
jgi:hypothetical protein